VEERPHRVRRDYRSGGGGRVAALVGILLGFGLLAAVAFALAGGGGGGPVEPDPTTSAPAPATAPPKPVLRIVFPEGFTREEMAKRIAEVNQIAKNKRKITPSLSPNAYLRASQRSRRLPPDFGDAEPPHLEGFLFPATYEFNEDTTSRELVKMQLDAFARAWEGIDLKHARSKNLSAYDVLIIASMVEKEVQVPKERALVAGVIYNRLKLGMSLGIDATIRYGLGVPATESLRESHLEDPTPYNTRLHAGLPPTPIGNPGLAAIQAAARPAQTEYLFFVRNADCKSHFFTASEAAFLAYPRGGLNC
jgi:UPF0755 protein